MGEREPASVRYLKSHDQVVAEIQEWMLQARLRAGDQLPRERELAQSLRVGLAQLRRALDVLVSVDVLERVAAGHRVMREPSPVLDRLLKLRMSLSGFALPDLMSTRLQLERASVERAATEATPADVDRLWSVVEQMTRPAIGHSEFSDLDCEFHLRLARAGHNNLAALLLCALGDAMKIEMRTGYSRNADWRSTAARLAAEHLSITDAVQHHQPDRAAAEITRHITTFYDVGVG